MQISELLHYKVSFQSSAWSSIVANNTISQILHDIKDEKYLHQVNQLRSYLNNGSIDKYNINKKRLPAVTFCGTFYTSRNKENLLAYNELMIIDIDKLEAQDLERVKKILKEEPFVFCFWESPSKKGIKGLIKLNFESKIEPQLIDQLHKSAFKKIKKYFEQEHGIAIDDSGSDFTRLCFLSIDKELVIKNDIIEFNIINSDIILIPESKDILGTSSKPATDKKIIGAANPREIKNLSTHRKTIQSIIRFLKKRNLSITNTYEEWYRISFAISNTFTYELGKKYFLALSEMDKEKYNENDCIEMLKYCYSNSSGALKFKSIVFFAQQKGYKIIEEKVPKNGKL